MAHKLPTNNALHSFAHIFQYHQTKLLFPDLLKCKDTFGILAHVEPKTDLKIFSHLFILGSEFLDLLAQYAISLVQNRQKSSMLSHNILLQYPENG